MFSPRETRTNASAEVLFGKDAAGRGRRRQRTGRRARTPPPPPPPAKTEEREELEPLERQSYRILRGRILSLPSLRLTNRQGQSRVFPWSYFGGASMDHPGELQLIFDGPEGSSTITVSGKAPGRGAAARHRKESGGVDLRAGRPGRPRAASKNDPMAPGGDRAGDPGRCAREWTRGATRR